MEPAWGGPYVFEGAPDEVVESAEESSWFPLYDRNPQTFVKNIMTAPAKAYRPETQTVYESARYPSHLDLPICRKDQAANKRGYGREVGGSAGMVDVRNSANFAGLNGGECVD